MKNNSEATNAPLSDADFKKQWAALEDEYEIELQQLHAEIELENKNNSAENSTDNLKLEK